MREEDKDDEDDYEDDESEEDDEHEDGEEDEEDNEIGLDEPLDSDREHAELRKRHEYKVDRTHEVEESGHCEEGPDRLVPRARVAPSWHDPGLSACPTLRVERLAPKSKLAAHDNETRRRRRRARDDRTHARCVEAKNVPKHR